MSNKPNLESYTREVDSLRKQGKEWGLTDEEIQFAFEESFLYLRDKYPYLYSKRREVPELPTSRLSLYFILKLIVIVLVLVALWLAFGYHKPSHNFIERNIQEIIYPFMKWYRRVTLPLVQLFPSLTELYDESCLVENPYFQVSNMSCWPCESVKFVLNLTTPSLGYHVGMPFIAKLQDPIVTYSDIQSAYEERRDVFDEHAPRIKSNYFSFKSVDDIFSIKNDLLLEYPDIQVTWRINRMEPGRALRVLLKAPREVPQYASAIGIERYILFDGPNSLPYNLPATEGANVFVKQLFGRRLILLEPTQECQHACHRLSIVLEEQNILWYNWWYWRPRSLPVFNSTKGSISLLGSSV